MGNTWIQVNTEPAINYELSLFLLMDDPIRLYLFLEHYIGTS